MRCTNLSHRQMVKQHLAGAAVRQEIRDITGLLQEVCHAFAVGREHKVCDPQAGRDRLWRVRLLSHGRVRGEGVCERLPVVLPIASPSPMVE